MKKATIQLRVTTEEKELWKQAASLRQTSLSQWIRSILDATANRTVERSQQEMEAESRKLAETHGP